MERRSWAATKTRSRNARRRSRPGPRNGAGGSSASPEVRPRSSFSPTAAAAAGSARATSSSPSASSSRNWEPCSIDLLEEDEADDRSLVFDIGLLADRLQCGADWLAVAARDAGDEAGLLRGQHRRRCGPGGRGAVAEAGRRGRLAGGRPDLAGECLPAGHRPTLLIVGGDDEVVLELNREAYSSCSAAPAQLDDRPGRLAPVLRAGRPGRGGPAGRGVVSPPPGPRPDLRPAWLPVGEESTRSEHRLDVSDRRFHHDSHQDHPASRPISRSRRSMPCGSPAHWPATTRRGCSSCTWSSRRSTTASWG